MQHMKIIVFCILWILPFDLSAQKILTNQVGYESGGPKRAVVEAQSHLSINTWQLINDSTGKVVFQGQAKYSGPVDQWKNWQFWTIDFSKWTEAGVYRLRVQPVGSGSITSYPFRVGKNILERATISDVVYYFKGQRSSGLMDQADRNLPLAGDSTHRVDVHGGWYDATGDYGKHLSHLSFSNYFNPQQIPLTAWSLLKTYQLLAQRPGTDFCQYLRRILDEGMYGADFLVRMQVAGGSFFRSVDAPGPGKLPKDRVVSAEGKHFTIKANKDASWGGGHTGPLSLTDYQVSWRSGGGMAIAALALASTFPTSGDFSGADYLKAAENAFSYLEEHGTEMATNGVENILDDYCALSAATELYNATHKDHYKSYAQARAAALLGRLTSWKGFSDYWRADDKDRPFFHAADAGLPVVSLLYYYPYADPATQTAIKSAVHRSLEHELSITHEVRNPFGYSRQLVQDTLGNRKSSFFYPHNCETAPWWQGEDARLGSMAAAARLAAPLFSADKAFQDSLSTFALDQLNWILGENPFDASMLQGTGHNNPAYGFFGTFEYTNAPGGIVNGITGGLNNENDIDLNLSYAQTGKDYDWRWAEQWLPHTSWYLLAVALGGQPVSAASIDAEHLNDHPTLAIGAKAPDFHLKGIDSKIYSLASFSKAKVLVIAFICNHCPTSQAYEKRIIRLTDDYKPQGVQVVAINPNYPSSLRIDELGYSDLGDSYPEMKVRARNAGYNFPYLYDGDKEEAAAQYGPVSTPHVFIFDEGRRLRYEGRIDDTEDPTKTPHTQDARAAIDALLQGVPVAVTDTKTFGCSIKWKEKTVWKQKAVINWAKEPVSLDTIGVSAIDTLLQNHTDKLRLINLWATWCVPCVEEYPDLVSLHRMYRDRGFQLISISTDDTAKLAQALAFLKKQESSSPNYIYTGTDKYALIDAINPNWKGALPFSILIEPGGKVVYAHQGRIDPEVLKKVIFDDPYMGRIYK
jgi:peroxiredoxin